MPFVATAAHGFYCVKSSDAGASCLAQPHAPVA
jgi:hypothetical protein